jgi:hypothetical protein
MSKATTVYYERISATVSEVLRRTWNQKITYAEKHRLENPSLMDILGAQEIDADQRPVQRPDQNWLQATGSGNQWLQLALAVEEKQ